MRLIYILQGSPYTNTDTLSNHIDRLKNEITKYNLTQKNLKSFFQEYVYEYKLSIKT